jgi:ankyrin repeat protein
LCLYRALITHDADANAPDHDEKDRETPLHLAAWYGYLPLVKYLIKKAGATIDAINAKGRYVSLCQ